MKVVRFPIVRVRLPHSVLPVASFHVLFLPLKRSPPLSTIAPKLCLIGGEWSLVEPPPEVALRNFCHRDIEDRESMKPDRFHTILIHCCK